jgi:hypothetical protein
MAEIPSSVKKLNLLNYCLPDIGNIIIPLLGISLTLLAFVRVTNIDGFIINLFKKNKKS